MINIECANCGVVFGVPEGFHAQRRRDGKTFHCPSGHSNYYDPQPTEEQKQIRDLERVVERRAKTYRELQGTLGVWKHAARYCPICEERVTTAQYVETIRAKVAEHLRTEHGARQRLRAITEKATA